MDHQKTMSSKETFPDAFTECEEFDNCPMCHGANFKLYDQPTVQLCADCGLFFHSPCPTQQEIKRSYDSGATYEAWSHAIDNHKRQFRVRLNHILPHAATGRLLDVGMGSGLFLKEAVAAGFEVEGTELAEPGLEAAHEFGFAVHNGQLTDIDFGMRRYDVISMWHVLEHVPNPGTVLKKIFELLNPGGVFAVAVPNESKRLILHQLNRLGGVPVWDWGWGTEIHLNHFFPQTLRKHLQKIGFEILDFGMDDVYPDTSLRSRAIITGHNVSSKIFRWNFGQDMYFICRRPL